MICDMQEERYEKSVHVWHRPIVAWHISTHWTVCLIWIFFFIHFKLIAFEWKFRIGTQMYTLYTYYTYYTTLMSAWIGLNGICGFAWAIQALNQWIEWMREKKKQSTDLKCWKVHRIVVQVLAFDLFSLRIIISVGFQFLKWRIDLLLFASLTVDYAWTLLHLMVCECVSSRSNVSAWININSFYSTHCHQFLKPWLSGRGYTYDFIPFFPNCILLVQYISWYFTCISTPATSHSEHSSIVWKPILDLFLLLWDFLLRTSFLFLFKWRQLLLHF